MRIALIIIALFSLRAFGDVFGPEIYGKAFESAGGDYITRFVEPKRKVRSDYVRVTIRRNGIGICKYGLRGIAVKHTKGSDIFETYRPTSKLVVRGDFRSDRKDHAYFRLNNPNIEAIQFFFENEGENDNIWSCATIVHAQPYKEYNDLSRYRPHDAIVFAGGEKIRDMPLGSRGEKLTHFRVAVPAFCNKEIRVADVSVVDDQQVPCVASPVDKTKGIYSVHVRKGRTASAIRLTLQGPNKTEKCAVPVALFE